MDKEIEYIFIMELEVPFTEKDLKKNYRNLSKLYHPDAHASESEEVQKKYEEHMKKVNAAHEYLKRNFDFLMTNNRDSARLHEEAKQKYENDEKTKADYEERKTYKQRIENLCSSINLTLTKAGDLYSRLVSKKYFTGTFEEWLKNRIQKLEHERATEMHDHISRFYSTLDAAKFFDLNVMYNLFITEKELLNQEIDIYSFLADFDKKITSLLEAAKKNAEAGKMYEFKTDQSKFLKSVKDELDGALSQFCLSEKFDSVLDVIANEIDLYRMCTILKYNLQPVKQTYESSMSSLSFEEVLIRGVELQEVSDILKVDKSTTRSLYERFSEKTGIAEGYKKFLFELNVIYDIESKNREIIFPDNLSELVDLLITKMNEFLASSENERLLGFQEWLKQEELLSKYNCKSYRELFAYIQNNLNGVPLTEVIDSLIDDSYVSDSTYNKK